MSTHAHQLLSYSTRGHIIEYTTHCQAMERISRLHQRAKRTGHSSGLLITGLSGSGKSTLKQQYQNRHPSMYTGEVDWVPVLTVETPAGPTVKNLAEAILIALGDTHGGGTTAQKTERIYHYLSLCKVELIIIDEFQHFIEHGKASQVRLVTDWLKSLIEKANIPVVLLGLPSCEAVLKLNVQLARRFSARYYLKPFGLSTEAEQTEFMGVLHAVQESLPLPCVDLVEPSMAQRFFVATYGLIDFVCKIVDSAIQLAVQFGRKRIDRRIFAQAFEEEVWGDAPETLNPFNEKAKLRQLTGMGEPFYEWAMASKAAKLKKQDDLA